MVEDTWNPEWCIVGNLLPYPYSSDGPQADFRSYRRVRFLDGTRLRQLATDKP